MTATLPGTCYARVMTVFLNSQHIRIFDYARSPANACIAISTSWASN